MLQAKSAPDPAVTRVAVQSRASAREHVTKMSNGLTVAVATRVDGVPSYWLATKQSAIKKATTPDTETGIVRGEEYIDIVWYEEVGHLRYRKLDYETKVSVSSVIVTVSNITWIRTTTHRFYLGETTHEMLVDIVQNMSHL